jgi:hypothetical protein
MPSKTTAAASKPGKGADRDATIKRIIELRKTDKLGVNAIAAKLDEEGYPTFGKAKKWPHRVVYGVLQKEGALTSIRKPSKAAQQGKDKRVDPGKTPAKTEKLANGKGDASDITDVPGAVVVKRGDKPADVKPDPKPSGRAAGRGPAKPTSTTRKTRNRKS